jgi:dystrophin
MDNGKPGADAAAAAGDEREDMQKKTFGKWINSQLEDADGTGSARVTDLYYDLRDGIVLLRLLEKLTGKKLRRERGRLRVHQLSNVNNVLDVLKDNRVKLVNINNVDVVDGNPKITLALMWAVVLHWQFDKVLSDAAASGMGGTKVSSNLEKSLMAWCRQATKDYDGVNLADFSSSWQDGLAFCAIVNHFRANLLDFEEAKRKSPAERLEMAFSVVKQHLSIPRLLDCEDLLAKAKPDKKSIMLYAMCLFQALPHDNIDLSLANVSVVSEPVGVGSPLKVSITEMKAKGKTALNMNSNDNLLVP